ncbi:MAG: hypothetical protein K6G17_09270 [Oscillospiraceae bacterium]|nr:hypothetical protein [Oscillospiraceae bacterium]
MAYKIADLVFDLDVPSAGSHRLLAAYQSEEPAEVRITVGEAEIRREQAASEETITAAYAETLAVQRQLSDALLEKGVLLFHGSAVAVDGLAYIFSAPSGTGKSTHARLWRELLGERAVMINDDKPFIRVGTPCVVFGSPWDGKHHLSQNTAVPLRAVCFLDRSAENQIRVLSPREALPRLLSQAYREEAVDRILPLVLRLADSVSLYELRCNISRAAAELSWNTLSGAGLTGGGEKAGADPEAGNDDDI